jgi:Kef-type K+ transport system membrane component KefB
MILGIPILRALLFDSEALVAIDTLSILGIVFLLFLAGLEIDLKYLRKTAKDSVIIGLAASLTPMLLGFFALFYLGYTTPVSLVFGICLGITAGGTIIGVLMDLNVVNTKLGAIFVAAGTVDDILEILLLSLITLIVQGGNLTQITLLPLQLLAFVVIAFALFKILERIMPYIKVHAELEGSNVELFSIAIIILIGLATLSELLQIGYLIGAIVAGFLLQYSFKNISIKNKTEIINTTRLIALAVVVPFFFVSIGLNFNIELLFSSPAITILAILIAIGGAIFGALLMKPFSKLSSRQLYLIGWAMSSKGSVELVVALLAQRYGILPPEIFSAVVAMAIVTTLTFPFVMKREIGKNRTIMDA